MHMVRHDHVAPHGPSVTITQRSPFFAQDAVSRGVGEERPPIRNARGNEIYRMFQPYSIESCEMPGFRHVAENSWKSCFRQG